MGRILIVEDDLIICEGLSEIIKTIEKEIEIVTTGYAKNALNYAINSYFDAFLLDIQLNDYSGMELAKQIRDIEKYKLTPIIFITSIPTKELLAFKQIHCYDYIVKPFSKDEVTKALRTIIDYGIKNEGNQPVLRLKQKSYSYIIKQNEIIYIEAVNKKIHITTINEEIILSTYSLKEIFEELTSNFIQCHRGYIINTDYIQKVDKANDLIKLKNVNSNIPIGRKYKEHLRVLGYDTNRKAYNGSI